MDFGLLWPNFDFWTLVTFSDTSNWFWILVLNGRFLILDTSERFWMLDTNCRFLNTCARFCLQTQVADFGCGTVMANFGFSDTSSQFRSVTLVNMFLNHLFLVEQGTYKEVGCCGFSVLYVNTNLLEHYLVASLYNL